MVNFSKSRRYVTISFERFRQRCPMRACQARRIHPGTAETGLEIPGFRLIRAAAGQEGVPRGAADCLLHVRVLKDHRLGCKRIQVWSINPVVAKRTEPRHIRREVQQR